MPSESLFVKCKSCGKMSAKNVFRCPNCGKVLRIPSAIHIIGIGFLAFIIYAGVNSPNDPRLEEKKAESNVGIKDSISKAIKLDFAWKKVGFGNVMEADLTIKNESEIDIKDIEIQCDHFAKSGTKIDSNNREIYEIFKANSKKSYINFNMGFIHDQASSSSCYIKDFSLANQ